MLYAKKWKQQARSISLSIEEKSRKINIKISAGSVKTRSQKKSKTEKGTLGEYVVLNGKTSPSAWLIENDTIWATRRYTGVETVNVDGTSYIIPVVKVYNTYCNSTRHQFLMAGKFDYSFIKVVAEAVFGKDIEIREPVAGEDLFMEDAMTDYYVLGGSLYEGMDPSEITEYMDLLVELKDQSKADFQKFRFSKYDGAIIDAKGSFDAGIE